VTLETGIDIKVVAIKAKIQLGPPSLIFIQAMMYMTYRHIARGKGFNPSIIPIITAMPLPPLNLRKIDQLLAII
tara:strand:+ start:267 stop:488 length:222 start_codon:yes stop_codon:yes gene_type:complete